MLDKGYTQIQGIMLYFATIKDHIVQIIHSNTCNMLGKRHVIFTNPLSMQRKYPSLNSTFITNPSIRTWTQVEKINYI